MVPGLQVYGDVGQIDAIYHRLAAEPSLLDDVWDLFEVDAGAVLRASVVWDTKKWDGSTPPNPDEGKNRWQYALVRLAAEDRLDRSRLLAASLRALQRDFRPATVGWYSALHEALEPTRDERLECSDLYSRAAWQLCAGGGETGAGRADEDRGSTRSGRARRGGRGGILTAAEGPLGRGAPAPRACRPTRACCPCQGARGGRARTRPRADGCTGACTQADRALPRGVCRRPRGAPRFHRCDRAVASITARSGDRHRDARGRRTCPACRRPGAGRRRAGPKPTPEVVLPQVEPLELVTGVSELIELAAALLEGQGTGDDAERFLDGVSRLCAERPQGFERRTASLLKRAGPRARLVRLRGRARR